MLPVAIRCDDARSVGHVPEDILIARFEGPAFATVDRVGKHSAAGQRRYLGKYSCIFLSAAVVHRDNAVAAAGAQLAHVGDEGSLRLVGGDQHDGVHG